MKYLVLILAVTACTKKPTCVLQDAIVDNGGPMIAQALECSNVEAVKSWVKAQTDKLNLCPQTKSVTTEICKALGGVVLAGLEGGIPSDWQCSPTALKEKAVEAINKACTNVFP